MATPGDSCGGRGLGLVRMVQGLAATLGLGPLGVGEAFQVMADGVVLAESLAVPIGGGEPLDLAGGGEHGAGLDLHPHDLFAEGRLGVGGEVSGANAVVLGPGP